MSIPTHTSNVTKYSNFLISISFKFRTIFFSYYTPILMKKVLSGVYLLIIKFIAIIQGPTTKWVFYAWIDLKQNIVSFTMVWYMKFFTWYILSQRIIFNVQKQCMKFLSKKIFKNIDAGRNYDCIFFWHACICGFSGVIVFGYEYFTVKLKLFILLS